MATLAELQGLFADASLLPKVQAACVLAAEVIRTEAADTPDHTARMEWAKRALNDPAAEAVWIFKGVLAQNSAFTVAQIQGATDAALKTAVTNAITAFVK